VEASDAVYVGDAVWDMKAAAALGIPAVGLGCGGTSAAELRDAGAAEFYEGPRDLLANLHAGAIGRLLSLESRV
jgi:phosphoglycolate phosphatase-like HAD superfamily hydrolase